MNEAFSRDGALSIGPLRADHWPDVAAIYAAGIATGNATFETEVPTWEAWDTSHLTKHRFICSRGNALVGWAAVGPVSARTVYVGVVEDSVYVAPDAQGIGVGKVLLRSLIVSTESAGIWTIQTGIFPENAASLAIHQAVGFRLVGVRERLGQLHGRWRDVAFLERRSPVVASYG
jgi:L-amino acid N-acyltransferase YncA